MREKDQEEYTKVWELEYPIFINWFNNLNSDEKIINQQLEKYFDNFEIETKHCNFFDDPYYSEEIFYKDWLKKSTNLKLSKYILYRLFKNRNSDGKGALEISLWCLLLEYIDTGNFIYYGMIRLPDNPFLHIGDFRKNELILEININEVIGFLKNFKLQMRFEDNWTNFNIDQSEIDKIGKEYSDSVTYKDNEFDEVLKIKLYEKTEIYLKNVYALYDNVITELSENSNISISLIGNICKILFPSNSNFKLNINDLNSQLKVHYRFLQ